MVTLTPLKSFLVILVATSMICSPMVIAKDHHYRAQHYAHGQKYHNKHHNKHHYKHYRHGHRYSHHRHHDGAALIGGAILGAVIVSAFDHHKTSAPVTVIQQGYATPNMIYRQLADGSCYRVSYDANGTEYLQKIHPSFCGGQPD